MLSTFGRRNDTLKMAGLLVLLALVSACGSSEVPAPEATESLAESPAPPTVGSEIDESEEGAPDPLAGPVFESASFNFRYRLPPLSWERSTSSDELPEAALALFDPERNIHFAVIPIRMTGVSDNLEAVRQAATKLLRERAAIVQEKGTSADALRGFSTRVTIAEGLIGNELVRLADHLLISAEGFYHLLTWAPLLELDDEEITAEARRLALRFELLDPTLALAVEAQGWSEMAEGQVDLLDFDVVDAAFSDSLGKIIAVSSNPPAVRLISPDTLDIETVPLERVPLRVALTPDGLSAAVSHPARLTLVNLPETRVVVSRPVSAEPGSLVFTSGGWVFLLPARNGHEKFIGARLPGGRDVASKRTLYGGSELALHPDEKSVYVASRGVSPDSIEKVDVSQGTPVQQYRWPYHGDYSACGDVWVSRSGRHLYTACGTVFNASPNRQRDMTYDGRLEGARFVLSLAESPDQQWLVVAEGDKAKRRKELPKIQEVRLFDARNLTLERVDAIPDAWVTGETRPSFVRFVFAGATDYYALVQLPVQKVGRGAWGLVVKRL